MLAPISWLREFTPYAGTARELGDKLTMLGLELEEIINPFADIAGIKVGYVLQCAPHPDSDHLHCCKVDLGNDEIVDIVCGAPNVADGQKVAVAPVGCKLPDGTVIKKAKLRGQPSFGMICSERELGLSEDHSGIMVLPDSVDVGQYLVDALGMDTEVLDLSITPNRADCLSILGIARETAMAFNLPLHMPELPLVPDRQLPAEAMPVSIDAPDLCWLYSGKVISDLEARPSPMRMRYRLIAVGVRPVSNIVDITNYIMFECGQPLHAFDMDKVKGGRIIVRRARPGEKIVTLDGKERLLSPDDLCIADVERAIGLAGVMGGLNSEISAETRNVFLESAVFLPSCVRKTSRRLGLTSEASYRFERGVDQRATIMSLNRACSLMASIGGGKPREGLAVAEPKPFQPRRVIYHPEKADKLLGVNIAPATQAFTLSALGCGIEGEEKKEWIVIQPSWRPDLTREADMVEEVGRVYGLDAIAPVLPPVQRALDDDLSPHTIFSFWRRIKSWGAGMGLNESVNYSFVGEKELDLFNMPQEGRIAILNPLSEEQNVMRMCLAPGLLRDLNNNLAYGAQGVKLFELANVFTQDKSSETSARENGRLGILLYGQRHKNHWPHQDEDFDYVDIKGLVENLLGFLHLPVAKFTQAAGHLYLEPAVDISIDGSHAGSAGRLRPDAAQKYNARKDVWLAELDLDLLRELHISGTIRFRPLPVYPAVKRDITVMTGVATRVDEIIEKIMLMKLPLLEGAELIDIFEPENTAERNLTFRLTFRHGQRTLKDAEVDKEREKVAEYLRKQLGARI